MRYHILNGDALSDKFPLSQVGGKTIVIREVFMEGPVSDVFNEEFWSQRQIFITREYDAEASDYKTKVAAEINRLKEIRDMDEVYLWFEDDLFCQCNMWFAVNAILSNSNPTFYRVYPEDDPVTWKGFGWDDEQGLTRHFQKAILLVQQDLEHILELWKAFVLKDKNQMLALSNVPINSIRHQKEVILAHLERETDSTKLGRPQKTLLALSQGHHDSFHSLFEKFSAKEAIYGFGDVQVKHMMEELGLQPAI